MTELQVIALQQAASALAAFHREHILIARGTVKLDADDTYVTAKVETSIKVIDGQLRAMCRDAGKANLYGTGIVDVQ